MPSTIRSLVLEILLSDYERHGRPLLPAGSRLGLQDALEEILIDRHTLNAHLRELQAYYRKRQLKNDPKLRDWYHEYALADEEHEKVLDEGLWSLPDNGLAALVINPVALFVLHKDIYERLPDVWLDILEESGRRLAGVMAPAVSQPSNANVTVTTESDREFYADSMSMASLSAHPMGDTDQPEVVVSSAENDLRLPREAFASPEAMAEALRNSALPGVGGFEEQAGSLAALAGALRLVEGRETHHAVVLLEAWLGLSEADYAESARLVDVLRASPLGQTNNPSLCGKVLGELASALRSLEGRGAQHAATLLESWLGVPESAYANRESLAAALRSSPLADIADVAVSAQVVQTLADTLLEIEGQGAAAAVFLLETWLGLAEDVYTDSGHLLTALQQSPLARDSGRQTSTRVLQSLGNALRSCAGRGTAYATLVKEAWLDFEKAYPAGPRRWRGEAAAEICKWESGSAEDLPERRARVEVEWNNGVAEVVVEGFLRVGIGYLLRAIWSAPDGKTERARGQVEDDFVPVRLQAPGGIAPAPGDCLELYQQHRTTATSRGWEVRTKLVFTSDRLVQAAFEL